MRVLIVVMLTVLAVAVLSAAAKASFVTQQTVLSVIQR